MSAITYTVKRGDNLTKICDGRCGADIPAKIAGNTVQAKINTLVSLNKIANPNLIYAGQVLTLSGSANASSSTTVNNSNCVTITAFGLQSESTTGRDLFASWSWHKLGNNHKNFKIRWEWDYNGETKFQESETTDTWATFSIPEEFRKTANWAKIFITPIAKNKTDSKGNDSGVPHWTAEQTSKQYKFADNPPLKPPSAPKIEDINKETLVLTASISKISATDLDAVGIQFNIVQDNSTSIFTTQNYATVNEAAKYVSMQYTVEPGHTYTVRARSVSANGKTSGWTDFSESKGTKPSAPASITTCRRDTHVDEENDIKTYSVFLEWDRVNNATSYKVEYTNVKSNFDIAGASIPSQTTDDSTPSIRIGISVEDLGYTYYFRVKAINNDGESDPSDIVELPIGVPPGPPSTWSTSDAAFVGETMELNWTHNPTDNSKQTYAQISFNFNDEKDSSGKFVWNDLEATVNSTDTNDTEKVTKDYTYGTAVSYKGNLYFKMDTTHPDLKNTKIRWKVRTAGVEDILSNDAWSVERTIYIYEKPTIKLSMTSDMSGTGSLITTLTSFPFYIRGQLSLRDYAVQRPVGYHLQIVSNEYYVTLDDIGQTKVINPGDAVYSKYFSTSSNPLVVEMSANNIDLESGITYTVYCTADMSTGLAVGNQESPHDFDVSWVDVEYTISADVRVDDEAYTATITPYCLNSDDGTLVDNITLAVYRREYDGSYKEIASGIPNNYTAVTDPHPALDYARYRFTAKDTKTGALSFWDMAGLPVNGSSIILQWAEEWSTFDSGESTVADGRSWTGSLLKLPYNIKVTDNRKPDVSLVNYIGRKHPVSYYSTKVNETSTWNVEIPKSDKETIYALRRLSLWTGDVYVREPSGMGYWANVGVSFNLEYNKVSVPITLDITRVEGGV